MTVLGGRYELGELLGSGGMAEVYCARDTLLGRDVAVKLFRHVDGMGTDDRRAGEVQLLAGLSHPGLVTVFDAGRDGSDFSYLVMEYVAGPSLRQRLDLGPLSPDETARLGAEVAAALAYIHARGIVHRDIKPANILLAPDGTAKLTDFGVAKLLDSARLTVTGTTLGTPNYLSPEQATGAPITAATDVYALGLVLLECLTGVLAFPGHGIEAALARLHRAPEIPARLGPQWAALLSRMTDRDPAARPDAATVAAQLGAPAEFPAATVAAEAGTTAPLPTVRRRARWWPATAAAAAVGALAVGIALANGSQPSTSAPPTTPASRPASTPAGTPSDSAPAAIRHPAPDTTPVATPRTTVVVTQTHAAPKPKPHPKPHPKPKPPHKPPKHHGPGKH